jgi:Flp pilus assembly protein TadG
MTTKRAKSGILIWLNSFRRDQKGVAAIEFALILPVLISFYILLSETANGMRASRKVTMFTRVMADLATRPADLTTAMKDDIFRSAQPIMNPFPTSSMGMRLTSIRFDATGRGTVDWSVARNMSEYPRCTSSTVVNGSAGIVIPDALKTPNTSLVLAETSAPYKPVIGDQITGEIQLRDFLFMRPRISDYVTYNGAQNPACP